MLASADPLPDALAGLRMKAAPPPTPCIDFDLHTTGVDRDAVSPLAGVELDTDVALVGTMNGFFYQVTHRDSTRIPDAKFPAHMPSQAAFKAADGTIYWIGAGGTFAYGTLEHGFQIATPMNPKTSSLTNSRALDGTRDGGPLELFAASAEAFSRYDGTTWTDLARRPLPPSEDRVDVAWFGRNQGIAVQIANSTHPIRDVGGTVDEPDLGVPAGDNGASAVAWVPKVGLVVGTAGGRFYIARGGAFDPIANIGGLTKILAIAPFDDGFVAAANGSFVQWDPSYGLCPPLEIYGKGVIRIVRLTNGFVLLPNESAGQQTLIYHLTRNNASELATCTH
jgi:hypothetical protein